MNDPVAGLVARAVPDLAWDDPKAADQLIADCIALLTARETALPQIADELECSEGASCANLPIVRKMLAKVTALEAALATAQQERDEQRARAESWMEACHRAEAQRDALRDQLATSQADRNLAVSMAKVNAAERDALREQARHRCSGCGHRWDGELKGAELCGDCWRKAQPVLHGL